MMNWRRPWIWLAGAGLVAAAVLVTGLLPTRKPLTEPGSAGLERPEPERIEPLAVLAPDIAQFRQTVDAGSPPSELQTQALAIFEKMPAQHQKYYKVAFGGIHDIEFHGLLVDQYEAPVANATVVYEGTGKYLASGAGTGSVITDAEGRFTISTRGSRLSVRHIIHPEITQFSFPLPSQPPLTDLMVDSVNRAISFSPFNPDDEWDAPNWRSYTASSPFVFKAWRVIKYEPVVHGRWRLGYEPDGRMYTLDLRDPDDWRKFRQEGERSGQLRLSCTRESPSGPRDRGDWRVVLSAVGGGIADAQNDLYLNEAPESGYLPSIEVAHAQSDSDYVGAELNRRYYFVANGGRDYGSLYVHFRPYFKTDRCYVDIEFRLNQSGSRNLAVPPEH